MMNNKWWWGIGAVVLMLAPTFSPVQPSIEQTVYAAQPTQVVHNQPVAQDEFHIEASSGKARLGQNVIITVHDLPDGAALTWIMCNENEDTSYFGILTVDGKPAIVFESFQAGEYRLIAVAGYTVDDQQVLKKSEVAIVVGTPKPPQPEPDPDDPDEPDTPDVPDVAPDQFNNLGQRLAAHLSASSLTASEKALAKQLAASYRTIASKYAAGAIADDLKLQAEISTSNESVLGSSLNAWKTALSSWLSDEQTRTWPMDRDTKPEYLRAIAAGLEGVK